MTRAADLVAIEQVLLDHASELVIYLNEYGEIVAAVGQGLEQVGYGPSERTGRHVAEHLHPEDVPAVLDVIRRARNRPDGFHEQLTVRVRHKDGEWIWFEATVMAVVDHGTLGTGAIVRVRRLEPESARTDGPQDRFVSLAEALPTGILSADARGHVVYCNEAVCRILDLPSEGVVGDGWMRVVHADDVPDVVEAAGLVLHNGTAQTATFRTHTGLFVRWATARFVPMGDAADPTGWIATIDDITDHRRVETQLAHRATHDGLTDLPNRALLEDRLDQAFARLRRTEGSTAVLFIDLDDFKGVNDTLGHEAGDAVLCEVAGRLREVLRASDTLARLGGDEFVAVCEGLDDRDAAAVAGRMEASLADPMAIAGQQLRLSASIGHAVTRDGSAEPGDVLARADQAMYRSKRAASELASGSDDGR